MNSTKTRLFT